MRVATWNVNNVVRRLDLLLDWLDRTQPDVVALQELKATAEQFPADALRELGYESLVVGQKTWNGVALLSRGHEIVQVATALPGDAKDKERPVRLPVPAEWKPSARPQVRLQASVV
jgi:exonuclease III